MEAIRRHEGSVLVNFALTEGFKVGESVAGILEGRARLSNQ